MIAVAVVKSLTRRLVLTVVISVTSSAIGAPLQAQQPTQPPPRNPAILGPDVPDYSSRAKKVPVIPLALSDSLSREAAAAVIRYHLARQENRQTRKFPLALPCSPVAGCVGIRTNASSETQLVEISRKIETIIVSSDVDYERAVASMRSIALGHRGDDYVYNLLADNLSDLFKYRELWRTGAIERFNWLFAQTPHWGDMNISGVGVLKSEYRGFCIEPYQEGNRACEIISAERSLESITGIRDGSRYDERIVEFRLRTKPTSAGRQLFGIAETTTDHVAVFTRYDDGWRMSPFF